MATHVTKEPVTLDGYQAILKPSEYGHTLTALLPKDIIEALEEERVGGLEWAKSKAKNPRRVTTKPEPWEEVSEGMYQCKFRWKEGDKVFYGHVTFLKENGIYIFETMNTGPLVKQGVNEFMFVLGQARIKGTVQMIINPVAIW